MQVNDFTEAKQVLFTAANATQAKGALTMKDAAHVAAAVIFLETETPAASEPDTVSDPVPTETPAASTDATASTETPAVTETPAASTETPPAPVVESDFTPVCKDQKQALNVLVNTATIGQKNGAFSLALAARIAAAFKFLIDQGLISGENV